MKHFALLITFLQCYIICQGQRTAPPSSTTTKYKPVIDSMAIVNWPSLGSLLGISNDGKFFMYSIHNQPANGQTIIIQSTENEWKKEFTNVNNGFFSADSRQFVYQSQDTLYFLSLGKNLMHAIAGVRSYKQINTTKNGWLAYLLNDNHHLVIQDTHTGKEISYSAVTDYVFSPGEKSLLLETQQIIGRDSITSLQWVNLLENTVRNIWTSKATAEKKTSILGYQFDQSGSRLTFITSDTTIWYYQLGMKVANIKANNRSSTIPTGMSIGLQPSYFNSNGSYIFFFLQEALFPEQEAKKNEASVSIWSYQDSVLPFKQKPRFEESQFLAAINLKNNEITRIEMNNESMIGSKADFALLADRTDIPILDYWWPSYPTKSYWLINLKTGQRKRLSSASEWQGMAFSPNGQYMVYYDNAQQHYFSYDLSLGNKQNISRITLNNTSKKGLLNETHPFLAIINEAAWLSDNSAILVYDDYDIWRLDLKGTKPPVNLTNGYGKKNKIKFRIVENEYNNILQKNASVILSAFNIENKYNGFYRLDLNKQQDPIPLFMGPCTIWHGQGVASIDGHSLQQPPLKAADSKTWIIKKETSVSSPNYFLTHDFVHYSTLTDLQPQRAYNWLTTELVTWQQLDSTTCQGVLYKPNNFDPQKKYPLIFEYYEEMSQNMYQFPVPDFSFGRINIPWYVSRGYLVFTPDIHFDSVKTTNMTVGDCAVNSLVSAANFLSKKPYIDSAKMGIQGHSFGGGETLYLITHTNLFSAACAAASTVSNKITDYLSIVRAHGKPVNSKMTQAEIGHGRTGSTLWQQPEKYMQESPVLYADKVTTPLLLMHNLDDVVCDWNQTAEMFMALRRLQKRVWFLQYERGTHVVYDKDAIDYTLRMQQFFDHYLKDAPIPKWMKNCDAIDNR